jgi:hypothetical protein
LVKKLTDKQIAAKAKIYNDWRQKLEDLQESDLAQALSEIEGAGKSTIAEIRQFGGYPWRMTFETLRRIYTESGDHEKLMHFLVDAFSGEHAPEQEDLTSSLECALGDIVHEHLAKKRESKAKSVLDFMISKPILKHIHKNNLHSYKITYRSLRCRYDIATGDYDAAIAFNREILKDSEHPHCHVDIAKIQVMKGDKSSAIESLAEAFRIDPTLREFVEDIHTAPELQELVQSALYRGHFPALIMPTDPVLMKAYKTAPDDPYITFSDLESYRATTADLLDILGVQLYCVDIICSDLDEHGKENLDMYGNGKVSIPAFFAIQKALEVEVARQMKATGRTEVPFWTLKQWRLNRVADISNS